MRSNRLFLMLFLPVLFAANAWAGGKEKVLYAFTGGIDGAYPSSTPLFDGAGNLYGTTTAGGDPEHCTYITRAPGCGVVFELTPTAGGQWQEKVLYAFQGLPDGNNPSGSVAFDTAGNLYGTTVTGGSGTDCENGPYYGCGTVFELSPNADGTWTETVLHNFEGNPDGANPEGLVIDAAGNLYGTTDAGGDHDSGTVFELLAPVVKGDAWETNILYRFTGPFNGDGSEPNGGLVFDSQGDLYGTTQYGGTFQDCVVNCGTVFELKRVGQRWKESIIYDFRGGGNGDDPGAGVVFDSEGNLYGTTLRGGNNLGIAFELSPAGGRWKEKMLYNFCSLNNCADGMYPNGLTIDHQGNIYGTTNGGGECTECGLLFKLIRTKAGWKQSVLHYFLGNPDGASPASNLPPDSHGNIYGTTAYGGQGVGGGFGTIFEFTP